MCNGIMYMRVSACGDVVGYVCNEHAWRERMIVEECQDIPEEYNAKGIYIIDAPGECIVGHELICDICELYHIGQNDGSTMSDGAECDTEELYADDPIDCGYCTPSSECAYCDSI